MVPQKRPAKDGLGSTKVKRLKEVPVVDFRQQPRQRTRRRARRDKDAPISGVVTFGGKLMLLVFSFNGLTLNNFMKGSSWMPDVSFGHDASSERSNSGGARSLSPGLTEGSESSDGIPLSNSFQGQGNRLAGPPISVDASTQISE